MAQSRRLLPLKRVAARIQSKPISVSNTMRERKGSASFLLSPITFFTSAAHMHAAAAVITVEEVEAVLQINEVPTECKTTAMS